MTAIRDINIGQRFSFQVYPTSIIGTGFQDVRLEGHLRGSAVALYGIDIASMHANVYPTLPAGTPDDPYQYPWIRVQHRNGGYSVVGVPWIVPESIEIGQGSRRLLTWNDMSEDEMDLALMALSGVGLKPDNVQVMQG